MKNRTNQKKIVQKHKPRDPALRKPTPEEVVEFLENYRRLMDPRERLPLKLISIKMDEPLLDAFKFKAGLEGIPYQTKIKQLMREWLAKPGPT
jgi:uncharacterized protein (DUF4415 family)